jgi:hypothetical protein
METNIIVQDRRIESAIDISIIQRIHEIRGARVMLDFDLAERYGIETGQLKRAVRRNIERFEGEDFMFELTQGEIDSLRCQFGILNTGGRGQHSKYLPFAFTELGVAMLSSVLNSKTAIDINRKIMRAFVAIRQYVLNYAELKHELYDFMRETNTRLDENDVKVNDVFKMLTKLFEQKNDFENRTRIGFKTKANP